MGCNTEETNPQVRGPFIITSSSRVNDWLTITSQASVSSAAVSFSTFNESRMCDSRRPFHSCSRRKPRMTDATVDKFRAALGSKLSLGTLLLAEGHCIAGTISKVGFLRRKTRFVPTLSSSADLRTIETREIQIHPTGGAPPMCPITSTTFARFPAWNQKSLFCAHMPLRICVCSHVLNPLGPCPCSRVEDNLGPKYGCGRGRSCVLYHQRALVAL